MRLGKATYGVFHHQPGSLTNASLCSNYPMGDISVQQNGLFQNFKAPLLWPSDEASSGVKCNIKLLLVLYVAVHTANSALSLTLLFYFSLIYAATDIKEMEPQHSPLKIARFADFGIGLPNLGDSWNMESGGGGGGSPPIGLGLELGRGSSQRQTGFTKSCGFTVFQLQELQLQSLIYKYMEAGLPVPDHLLLPIWKSVAGSLGGLHGSPYQLYTGYLGCGSLHLEYKNGFDPEPGRCRRTDGKKWRCSKEAVPDHKYCERHMHRGRQRSRKLVEAPSTSTSSNSRIRHGNTDTNLSISLQLDSRSSSSNNGSNLTSGLVGFSPKSVLRGSNPKPESSLQFQGF
ncbi:hypothetical protein V6N11_071040 [Hibiscus sabdariffa]|uniref:Growth-regulating factor n=1 Tax=Hibiscus sabdariffa TaxID=183260 RepID=A0ABR1ZNM5_9ROSI